MLGGNKKAMVEMEPQSNWNHHTGAHAWMHEVEGVVKGVPVRQANLHVEVPSEHRGKGIAKELLAQAISDLESYNHQQSDPSLRFHNAFVNLAMQFGEQEAAKKTFESVGFKVIPTDGNNMFLQIMLSGF